MGKAPEDRRIHNKTHVALDLLVKRRVKSKGSFESSNFPIVQRDIAFYVPISLEAEHLLKILKKQDIQYVQSLGILDLYQEPHAEQKSVTVRITLQASDHTLSDKEIMQAYQEIIKNIETHLGGSFRAAT